MNTSDALLIAPSWMAPVAPSPAVLTDHAIVIRGSTIEAIAPIDLARRDNPGIAELSLPGHLITPGLINLHTHAAMSLLRGLGDDLPLARWLEEKIWPAEAKLAAPILLPTGHCSPRTKCCEAESPRLTICIFSRRPPRRPHARSA